MKLHRIASFEEAIELAKKQQSEHYWHDRLPADFIKKAERIYDRLKGIDSFVDATPKAKWVDLFRIEKSPDDALAVYAQRLAALSKAERKWGKKNQIERKAIYCLAAARGFYQNGEDAFRLTEEHYGFQFHDSEKKPLMRLVESCVSYRPIVYEHDVVPAWVLNFAADQNGSGKSSHYRFSNGGFTSN